MSELTARDGVIDAGEAEPDGITDSSFAPFAFTAGPTGFAIARSPDPEEQTLTNWQEYIDYIWRKMESVPPHEKANLFVGYSSLAVFSRQIYKNSGDPEHLDQAISWARDAEEFGLNVSTVCKAPWPALLAELLLQRFEQGQMLKDLEDSCQQFQEYLHNFDQDAFARGTYADLVCGKLRRSTDQVKMARLLDEALVFAQIAETAPYEHKQHLAHRLQTHGILLFMKGDDHMKPETLKMALSKLQQAISMGLSEEDEARAKSLIAMLYMRLKNLLPDFETPPGFGDDLLFGNSMFSQVRKIEFSIRAWEAGMRRPGSEDHFTQVFLVKAEEFVKEALESEENPEFWAFEPEILVLAGQISEACQGAFDGKRSLKLEDPAYYWTRCWSLGHGPLHFRLRAIHQLSCRLFRDGDYEAAWARFQLARALIPILSPQQFKLQDKVHLLQSLEEMSVDACATALILDKVDDALEVLEEGRGLLLGHFDKSSKDLDRLERQHITLFHKFQSVRKLILYGEACPPDYSRMFPGQDKDTNEEEEEEEEEKEEEEQEEQEEEEFDRSSQPSTDGNAWSEESEEQVQLLVDDDAFPEDSDDPRSVSDNGESLGECEESRPLVDPMGQVIKEIRSMSGFEDFLVPLTAKEIRGAAQVHPVVVLVGSILHQDAIILSGEKVDHVDLGAAVDPEHFIAPKELRVLSREDMSAIVGDWNDFPVRNKYLVEVLRRLWKGIAEPICNALGFEKFEKIPNIQEVLINSMKNHVIWMRTGDFHRLPINMALDGSSNHPTPFMAYATSSFTSSFRALLATQSRQQSIIKRREVFGSIISMPPRPPRPSKAGPDENTQSLRSRGIWIRNAHEEGSRVQKASPDIKWDLLERPSPQMLQQRSMESCFLHLVCHGVSVPNNPMQSYLQLWDASAGDRGRPARLTISQIAEWTTTSTCLAFLSSCSTADAAAPTLYEENVDICNALNLAGVCDVVGSTWPIPDKVGVVVAEEFWRFFNHFMPDDGEYDSRLISMALNAALAIVGSKNPSEPLSWAGFIHVGGKFEHRSEQ